MAATLVASDRPVTDPSPSRLHSKRTWGIATFVLVVLALAALIFVQAQAIRSQDDLQSSRAAAVNAASDEVVDLLTVEHSSAAADLKKLLAGATAGFHDQLQQQAASFQQALAQGKVVSSGSIAAAALVSMTGDTAVVTIAAKATVKNAASPAGEARNYRLTVTVKHVASQWLVAGLTFVV
jgi:Mce-associated membrane protein